MPGDAGPIAPFLEPNTYCIVSKHFARRAGLIPGKVESRAPNGSHDAAHPPRSLSQI